MKTEKELINFAALGTPAFDFWDNPEDDIYEEYYKTATPDPESKMA